MGCEQIDKFITKINSYSVPREGEDRASISKYSFRGEIAYFLDPTSSYQLHMPDNAINSHCEQIHFFL